MPTFYLKPRLAVLANVASELSLRNVPSIVQGLYSVNLLACFILMEFYCLAAKIFDSSASIF